MDTRPLPITSEQFLKVCATISESAKSLKTICTAMGISNESVYQYMQIVGDDAKGQYARAKSDQTDWMSEELQDIADHAEDSNKARLQVDTRKWVMSKLKPKRYGDHQQIEIISSVNQFVESTIKIIKQYIPVEQQAEVIAKIQSSIDFD